MLLSSLFDNSVKLGDLIGKFLLLELRILILLGFQFELGLKSVLPFLFNGEQVMFIRKSNILGVDFFLELDDLMGSDLELSFQFSNFILALDQVLGVEVSVRSDSFIEVLLLFELSLELQVLLLEFGDHVFLQLNFFHHLHQVSICFRSLS